MKSSNIWKLSYGMRKYKTLGDLIFFKSSFYDEHKNAQYPKYWEMKDGQRNRRLWFKLRGYTNPKKRCLGCIRVIM